MSEDAGFAPRFLWTLFATVVKPISDLRILISGLFVLLLALCFPAEAQQAAKIAQIGFMGNSPTREQVRIEVFRQKLWELGWVEGQTIIIEYRWANGKFDRVPELAAELVNLKVKVIFAPASLYVEAARQATATIPSYSQSMVIRSVPVTWPASRGLAETSPGWRRCKPN